MLNRYSNVSKSSRKSRSYCCRFSAMPIGSLAALTSWAAIEKFANFEGCVYLLRELLSRISRILTVVLVVRIKRLMWYGSNRNGFESCAYQEVNVRWFQLFRSWFYVQLMFVHATRKVNVACRLTHTLALSDEGNLFVWGGNIYGQLDFSHRNTIPSPIMVNDFLSLF